MKHSSYIFEGIFIIYNVLLQVTETLLPNYSLHKNLRNGSLEQGEMGEIMTNDENLCYPTAQKKLWRKNYLSSELEERLLKES